MEKIKMNRRQKSQNADNAEALKQHLKAGCAYCKRKKSIGLHDKTFFH